MAARSFVVSGPEGGQTLAAVVRRRLALSWSQARRLIEQRRVRLAGATCADPVRRVAAGQAVSVAPESPSPDRPARRPRPRTGPPGKAPPHRDAPPRPTAAGLVIRDSDPQIVVVEKPAGLTTVRHASETAEFGQRAQRFLPPTLADLLPKALGAGSGRPAAVRAVHRLDRDTSGLVVFARTPEAEADLGRQFRAHTIERRYLAVVRGRPEPGRVESVLVRDRGDGRRGSATGPAPDGQRAVTHVRVVEELGPFTLVECRLETGRTHQVRIHLGEQGTPLCGERVYDRPPHGAPAPDASGAKRVALHAARLGFRHPATGAWMEWESPLPEDLAELVERLKNLTPRPPSFRGKGEQEV
jgi:23S rRNA pseudouridine1911/1915/1917 synthase